MIESIFEIVLGIIVLTHPFEGTVVAETLFSIFIGFWALLVGVFFLSGAFITKKRGKSNWFIILLGGIFSISIGWLIIRNPVANSVAMTTLIGIFTIVLGILTILISFELKHLIDMIKLFWEKIEIKKIISISKQKK